MGLIYLLSESSLPYEYPISGQQSGRSARIFRLKRPAEKVSMVASQLLRGGVLESPTLRDSSVPVEKLGSVVLCLGMDEVCPEIEWGESVVSRLEKLINLWM